MCCPNISISSNNKTSPPLFGCLHGLVCLCIYKMSIYKSCLSLYFVPISFVFYTTHELL
jgi:hypothetical protein